MSDLVQRVERAMAANYTVRAQAKAAIREVLAALREPSATVLEAARPINPYPASTWRLMLDAFAREHGLEEPPP